MNTVAMTELRCRKKVRIMGSSACRSLCLVFGGGYEIDKRMLYQRKDEK